MNFTKYVKMKKTTLFIVLIFTFLSVSANNETYDYSAELIASKQYNVTVNEKPVFVLQSLIPASYAAFGTSGEATIYIETTTDVKWVDVRPKSLNIKPVIKNKIISFTIPGPCLLSVEIRGSINNPLFIFANPIEQKPSKNNPDIIYFEAGKIHKAGTIHPKNNQTVYIEGGAVVEGAISAKNVANVKVAGYGVLDGTNNNQLTRQEMAAIFNVQGGYEGPCLCPMINGNIARNSGGTFMKVAPVFRLFLAGPENWPLAKPPKTILVQPTIFLHSAS